jgi:hypothetical protein
MHPAETTADEADAELEAAFQQKTRWRNSAMPPPRSPGRSGLTNEERHMEEEASRKSMRKAFYNEATIVGTVGTLQETKRDGDVHQTGESEAVSQYSAENTSVSIYVEPDEMVRMQVCHSD